MKSKNKNAKIKKYSKLVILTSFITLGLTNASAQVGMMTNNPDKSAVLDMKDSSNKGLLIPNVFLDSTVDKSAIKGGKPAQSLMVYNTNAAISGEGNSGTGYYYWDTNIWKKLLSSGEVVGDDLGNHIATKNLNMNSKDIDNIMTASMVNGTISNALNIKDKNTSNNKKFTASKNNGTFSLYNEIRGVNELSIDEITGKTTLTSAAVQKDLTLLKEFKAGGNAGNSGQILTSGGVDAAPVWIDLKKAIGASSVQFLNESTGWSIAGSTKWNDVPGFENISYTAPSTGDLIVQIVIYTSIANPTAGNPAMTNTQIQFAVNDEGVAYGMSTPIGIANAGQNPECTVVLTKIRVIQGTKYLFKVQARDVWNSNAAGAGGGKVGTFTWQGYTSPATILGTLITTE